jgi:hypothetical protein
MDQPKRTRAEAARENGKRGGRPKLDPHAGCTCGAPNGIHRQPCPCYKRQQRAGIRVGAGRPRKTTL